MAEDDHGSWFFSLELPRRIGGSRRRIRRGGYASREEAERALGRLQVTGGRVLTVADWPEIWLATRAHVRDKTLRGYTAHVRLHLVLSPAASDTAVVYSLGIAAVILLITFGALAAYKSGLVHPTPPRHEASGP